MEKVRNDHDNCYVEIPNEDKKILKYKYREKSLKASLLFMLKLLQVVRLTQQKTILIVTKVNIA